MLIGVPKEIKNHEYRIGLTPAGIKELVRHGHQGLVERIGGRAGGFDEDQYRNADNDCGTPTGTRSTREERAKR